MRTDGVVESETPWMKLVPWAESALYTPISIYPVYVILQATLPHTGLLWKVFTFAESRPIVAISMLVIWQPVFAPFFQRLGAMVTTGYSSGRHTDQILRGLLKKIRLGQDISADMEVLKASAASGSLDWESLEARLWIWIVARYTGDYSLEQQMRAEIEQLLWMDKSEYSSRNLWPPYLAWHIRTEMALAKAGLHALMPQQLAKP